VYLINGIKIAKKQRQFLIELTITTQPAEDINVNPHFVEEKQNKNYRSSKKQLFIKI